MPTYSLESPQTGQKYLVQFDGEPSPADLEFAAQHFDNEWWKQQGIEPGSAITQQTPLETVGNAIANVGPNLVDMVGGGMRYLDKAAQVVADVTGTQRGGLFADVAKQAEGIKAEGDVLRPLSPANPMAQAIGGGASQGIGLMATAAASVPALGARGLMAVPAVLGFGAGGGAGVQQAEQMGITSPAAQLGMGTAFGAAEAGTEALGGIGGAFFKPAKTMLGRMAGGVLSEGIEEPAAGALQDAITNVAALAVADPKRPGFTTTGFQIPGPAGYLERRGQEAIGGLAGGLVFAGMQPLMRAPGVGQPLSEAPASAPDAVPESTGDLTAADVADLETLRQGDGETGKRQPILSNVPDRMARVQQESDADLAARINNYRGFLAANPGYVGVEQDLQAALAEQQRRLGFIMPSDISTQPFASAATQDQPQTITGSNEQTGSEMPVPPPTAEAGAGAGGVEGMVNDEGGMMNGKQVVVPKVDVAYKAVATEWERQNIMDELAARLGLIKVYSSITGGKVIGNQFDPKHLGKTGSDLSRKGYFFTNSKSVAANYARVNGGKVMEFYINPQNVLEVEGTNEMYRVGQDAEKIFASGKKVILFKNADDVHGVADNYMVGVGNEHLIKSANPTELDDNGNLILPSRRLDFSSKDIRGKLTGEAQRAQMGFTNLDTSGRTAGFLNTEILSEAEALVRRGVTSFVQWSQAMVRRFGEAIRAYLGDVWDNVRRNSELGAVMNPLARGPLRAPESGMASASGAAQTPESSPGGLSEADAEYLDAVNRGDMEKAQRMVDEAANDAADTLEQHNALVEAAYLNAIRHGNLVEAKRMVDAASLMSNGFTATRRDDFTVARLNKAQLREVMEIASNQTSLIVTPAALYEDSEPIILARNGKPDSLRDGFWRVAQMVKGGYDGNIPVIEMTGPEALEFSDSIDDSGIDVRQEYVTVYDAAKVAIADPSGGVLTLEQRFPYASLSDIQLPTVLRDDAGNIIPPSRRFDLGPDIRGNINPESSRAAGGTQGFKNLDTSGRTAGFLNTEILSEARQLIADGFTTFANWSQAMVTRFGRGIREFLQGIWQQITSPQTNAAQNVRLGGPQGNAPVSIGAGGFVGGGQASNVPEGQDVTRSRFASPDEAENLYDVQATETMRAESAAWLEANGIEAALAAMEANSPPQGLRIDHLPSLGAQVITRLAKLAENGTEAQRLQADALLDRAGRAWHGKASQEAGRTLQQRAMATDELRGIAPILATKQVLVERADRVVKERFEGGAEGAVQQVKDIDTKASTQAGEELAADLEAETAAKPNKGGNAIPPSERVKPAARSGRITAKHPNLKKMLDALRKKVATGMTWAEIFMSLPAEQKARQREIYRRLMLDERLKALNQGERLQLTNELDRAWQRERRKVFVRELEKITGLGKTPKDRDKVKAALPRLLRLMNLGMLNSETFRGAIAQEYGIQQIDAATGAELRRLGEQIQQAPEGLPRRKLEQQLMQRLQNLTGSTMAEVLESWWTASVLSGWRTQMDIALSLANGLEDVALGSLVTALRTGNGRVAKDALFGMLSNLPTAMNEALDHLITGNRAAMRSYDAEVKAALEDGNKLFGNVGRQLLNKGGMAKLPGAFMEFVSRMMTALDHINSTSTYEGAKAMALARHPELYEKALTISPQDRQAARTQARLELTGGGPPTTRQQRVEETARMKEILDQRVPLEVQAQAREIGLESALQGGPTGVGGWIYRASNALNNVHRQSLSEYEKNRPDNLAGRAVLRALRITSTLVKILTGTKFVRTVGHSINRSLSYAPGVGLVRFAEGGMKGAKADILLARQLMGTAVGLALLMAFRDGEDDEQGIEGSWRELTPQQKGQLLAEGKQPYSIWTRDAQGKIRTWNYQQWGIAGVLATIGAMEDQRRYNSQGKDDLAILMDGIVSGSMAWTDKTQLTGLQMLMGKDQAASSSPSSSLAGALNKWASTTVGGLVPRIFKDVDMVISPQLRDTSEWWMKWAGQVPMVRELSSGKRVNIFGEDIVLDRGPTSRITQVGTIDPALRTLGRLNERDIWLPDPTQGVRTVLLADGTRRKMTTLEKDRYQRATGAAYRKFITEQGAALLQMDAELARETISKVTERLRRQAAYDAVRR